MSSQRPRGTNGPSCRHAELQACEAALRRVTTLVAANASLAEVASRVSHEASTVLDLPAVAVVRFDVETATTIAGSARTPTFADAVEVGRSVNLTPDLAEELARSEASTRRVMLSKDSEGVAKQRYASGVRASLAIPVLDGSNVWGAVVAHASGGPEATGRENVLAEFAAVVELGLANERRLQTLESMAATDSLTGLTNHRTFFARLEAEGERARRYGRDMALALIDLDNFKEVNDALGHQVGDEVLVSVATFLQSFSRSSDVVARVGGEEFAWLMPETDGGEAMTALERARGIASEEALGPVEGLTFSAGICDSAEAGASAEELFRLADTALYEAKRRGRNRIVLYRPSEVVGGERDTTGQSQFERGRRLQAIQALARSLDSPRPGCWTHSERVSDLAARLATKLGWPEDRVSSLREAALVHDVGKVSVPRRLLEKRHGLEETDMAALRAHASLGAVIVEDVLTREQTSWVLHHHERWDGNGYPDGIAGADIPDGARVLAVANSWDVVTHSDGADRGKKPVEALGELIGAAGTQFATDVVDAFVELWNADELDHGDGPPLGERSRQVA